MQTPAPRVKARVVSRLLFCIATATLIAGAVACGADQETAEPAAPDAEETRLVQELRRAIREVAAFEASAKAQHRNAASHHEALEKAQRVFSGLGVGARIPDARDEASIGQAIEDAADAAGMRVRSLTTQPRDRDARTLPSEVRADEQFRFRADDIREVLEVRFELAPPDIARLEAFDRALSGPKPQRFVVLRRARATPSGFEVEAEAFRFVETAAPTVVARAPTEGELLSRPAIAERLSGRRDRPAVQAELTKLRQRLERASRAVPTANRALRPIGEANLWVARTAILERAAARAQDRSTADIME